MYMDSLSTRMMRLVECCFFLAILSSTQANIEALCDSADMYWEIREDKQENNFTCKGLATQDTVQWALYDSAAQYILLGTCQGDGLVCESKYPVTQPNRISANTSVITINTSGIPVPILYGKGRLICSVPNVPGAEASCRMDYIYPAENISCSVQVNNNTRTVFGQCAISKVRSTQNRYRCEWIQTKVSSNEENLVANTSMTVVAALGRYFSGWCNMTSYLPPDGLYTYRVTLVPGEVTVNASFIGDNRMFKTTVATPEESTTTTKTTIKSSATTTEATASTVEKSVATTEKRTTTRTTTKVETITTEKTTVTKEKTTAITYDAIKTTTAKTASTTKEAVSTGETTTQMSAAASTITAASDYTANDITATPVTKTVLWGQRCEERCSSCKRVTVQVKMVSGPVISP